MTIDARYKKVLESVRTAALSAGRNPLEVHLVAVSKTHGPEVVREAIGAGAEIFGENKVQEGVGKIGEVGKDGIEWHLIGHLQKNKVRKAVRSFDVIQTVDTVKLATRLDRIAGEESRAIRTFVQVDLAGEASKSGARDGELFEIAEFLKQSDNLIFDGLMAIPPFFEDPEDVRPFFRELRKLRDELREAALFPPDGGELSMGMSHDFVVAIEEGATYVRVGTAIFGARELVAA